MGVDKIRVALERRPAADEFREQLFWLVDLIYACNSTGDAKLMEHARLLEDALGGFGDYLETGEAHALESAQSNLEEFARCINGVLRATR